MHYLYNAVIYLTLCLSFSKLSRSELDGILKEPYLATAIRLSLPRADEEPNREELLKEIEKLESDIAGLSSDIPDEAPATPPNIQKRYLEWPGKRSVKSPESGLGFGYRPMKTWNSYLDKATSYNLHRTEPLKRWAEFVGKRQLLGNRPFVNRKRWYEFVGKRFDPALFMSFSKRHLDFDEKK